MKESRGLRRKWKKAVGIWGNKEIKRKVKERKLKVMK